MKKILRNPSNPEKKSRKHMIQKDFIFSHRYPKTCRNFEKIIENFRSILSNSEKISRKFCDISPGYSFVFKYSLNPIINLIKKWLN